MHYGFDTIVSIFLARNVIILVCNRLIQQIFVILQVKLPIICMAIVTSFGSVTLK